MKNARHLASGTEVMMNGLTAKRIACPFSGFKAMPDAETGNVKLSLPRRTESAFGVA